MFIGNNLTIKAQQKSFLKYPVINSVVLPNIATHTGLNGENPEISNESDTASGQTNRPAIVISDLQLFNKSVKPGQQYNNRIVLEKPISDTEKISLYHKQNVFTLVFNNLISDSITEPTFKYILEGFNNDWLYTNSHNRSATYTNLNPGKYTFKVTYADNNDLDKNLAGLDIVILPPWWQTWWFKMAVIVFFIGSLIGIYIYRLNRLRLQKIYLEEQVKQRTYEIARKNSVLHNQTIKLQETNTLLEERQQHIEEQSEELKSQKEELEQVNMHLNKLNTTKDKFFSIISHDLKNPFNIVLGFGELLFKNFNKLSDDKKLKYAEAIYTSSRNIYNLLENLLQWSRAQNNKIEIDPDTLHLNEIMNENVNLLSQMLKKKNINVNFKSNDKHTIFADKNLINTIVRNLLTNAIKFSNHNDEICIDYAVQNDHVQVSITDNGVGMSQEMVNGLFKVDSNTTQSGTDGETGTGLGLILCKEYIEKKWWRNMG
ncbi:MAG: hypothetical protein GVY19_00925 [Bacteroidetes bacterium]|jgi:signal transduction histidine kinase|nr:hypothetical protein [Bacteroidota bacterium]